MSMPSATRRNGPDAKRPLDEMQRQAQIIANFAEYLAEDVRRHPERIREAISALAEWCKADVELLTHARTEVLRHRRAGPPATVENNRYAIQLHLVDSTT